MNLVYPTAGGSDMPFEPAATGDTVMTFDPPAECYSDMPFEAPAAGASDMIVEPPAIETNPAEKPWGQDFFYPEQ